MVNLSQGIIHHIHVYYNGCNFDIWLIKRVCGLNSIQTTFCLKQLPCMSFSTTFCLKLVLYLVMICCFEVLIIISLFHPTKYYLSFTANCKMTIKYSIFLIFLVWYGLKCYLLFMPRDWNVRIDLQVIA